jgi:hypothetical protein
MGSKDRKPRVGSRWHGWAEEVAQRYEQHEYFSEEVGSSYELLEKLYKNKDVPLKYRMYAENKAVDIEPRPVITPPLSDADKEENQREWQKLIEYFATLAIKETVYQLNGKPAGDAGVPAWIPALVSKIVAETQAALGVPITKVVPARQRVFWGGQSEQQIPYQPQPPRQTNGAQPPRHNGFRVELRQHHNGASPPKPNGVGVEFARILYCDPHRAFWLMNRRLEANEHGELNISDLDETSVELLLAQGCRRQQ